jgi:hypothetical protein
MNKEIEFLIKKIIFFYLLLKLLEFYEYFF